MNIYKKIERKHAELLKLVNEADALYSYNSDKVFENYKSYRHGVEYVGIGIYFDTLNKEKPHCLMISFNDSHGVGIKGQFETQEQADKFRNLVVRILKLKEY